MSAADISAPAAADDQLPEGTAPLMVMLICLWPIFILYAYATKRHLFRDDGQFGGVDAGVLQTNPALAARVAAAEREASDDADDDHDENAGEEDKPSDPDERAPRRRRLRSASKKAT